jgi:hypothetical protein
MLYKYAPEKDAWYLVDPRHQTLHLLPANEKKYLCGIPYTYGTYVNLTHEPSKLRKCKECERKWKP